MDLFLTLGSKILPLYGLIALGFVAKKNLQIDQTTFAKVLIYITAPAIVFQAALTTPLQFNLLALPLLFLGLGFVLNRLWLIIGSHRFKDSRASLLAFVGGTGNTGYFGLSLILATLGESALNLAVFCVLGTILYENTIGYFTFARANFTWKTSLHKLFRLPSLYAVAIGLLLNILHIPLAEQALYQEYTLLFRGCHIIFGMMLIGCAMANVSNRQIDYTFMSLAFFAKFFCFPLAMYGCIILDRVITHLFSPLASQTMLTLSLVPLAANTVAYATELKVQANTAAMAVFLSTLFAAIYIPLMVTLLNSMVYLPSKF